MWQVYAYLYKKPPSFFQSGCTILHSQQQFMIVPVASHPHQHLVLSTFFFFGHFTGWEVVSTVALIRISLMTSDVRHLLIYLFDPITSFLVKCLVKFLCQFLTFWEFFVHSKYKFYVRYVVWKYFFPLCSLPLNSLVSVFCRAKVLNFYEVQFIFFYGSCFWYLFFLSSHLCFINLELCHPSPPFTNKVKNRMNICGYPWLENDKSWILNSDSKFRAL